MTLQPEAADPPAAASAEPQVTLDPSGRVVIVDLERGKKVVQHGETLLTRDRVWTFPELVELAARAQDAPAVTPPAFTPGPYCGGVCDMVVEFHEWADTYPPFDQTDPPGGTE